MNKDIRWQQRFINFNKVFNQLAKFIKHEELNEMEEQGLIKAFEYTYELSWKTLQDLLRDKGYHQIAGPKPVIEQSFQDGYISNGKGWMRMHQSRNLASHTYDEKTAAEIIKGIRSEYFPLLQDFMTRLNEEKSNYQKSLFDE
ncbi:nucleotidyltransferase substrate binding protein [Mangrovibacterium marinum]|uniref:Nucleotidyltransferase substrate binding protein (TIGR01987 family) n=1 Tax=Mangrovibacterium marinum TaxID=1639118 RepID=A0A2T5C442_9BACT|nr:nucleotidyltransferase substrate binding protein [Mangrovibacterium marinum]PTN09573.1 nucleotidyltransferase substrate binding protein (TIGR01987 family) [Mangrovibacterium marinum]